MDHSKDKKLKIEENRRKKKKKSREERLRRREKRLRITRELNDLVDNKYNPPD